jgi:cytochrome c oxidase subunit 3
MKADSTVQQQAASRVGIALLIVTISLLFGTISLLFMAAPPSEQSLSAPPAFWLNTIALAASSWMLQRAWNQREQPGSRRWLLGAMLAGLLFLLGQVLAWAQLYAHGISFSGSGVRASYLYTLSGLHAFHLVGGLLFCLWVWGRFERGGRQRLDLALYLWHFLGILWLYLLGVLMVNL